jgi:hypothetical protein
MELAGAWRAWRDLVEVGVDGRGVSHAECAAWPQCAVLNAHLTERWGVLNCGSHKSNDEL